MQSKATTVEQYLAELPSDRRAAISAVREVILRNLDKDYEEGMTYGMIGYYVPHRVYPAGYHCDPRQPLPFAGLASQKNHMAVYMMCIYGHLPTNERFRTAWAKTGKKLDMGKSCIRFKKLEDLALDVIGDAIRSVPTKNYIEYIEAAWGKPSERKRPGAKSNSTPSRSTTSRARAASARKSAGKVKSNKSKKTVKKSKSKR
ncbi:MAG: DUF1801 domain-containing protein [Planctomycetes bacterium]|nr:DUF1801 domain-containing protein [Planctomycetota bacterium]MBI3833579.1 DUF1801 domain-containing protein [Planctomycetota bacterium]